MELDDLTESIDHLAASDPSVYADAESIEVLHRELARLEAVTTEAVDAFNTSGTWALDGARTASAWVATRCRLPRGEAQRRSRLGRQLADLPMCRRAWSAGEINAAHVSTIAALRRESTAEALERDEAVLVDQAKSLRFDQFNRAAKYWEQYADPDGTDEAAEERRSRRDVYLASTFDGMFLGKMTLDAQSGSTVSGELTRLERQLFEADWAEAKDNLGREPRVEELSRTSAQRRADALVEMAIRSRTAPADGQRPAPQFSVLVGYETFHGRICQLANGAVVSPGSLLPWLDEAYLERVVFRPGRRVEVSPTVRLFSGATRRAIEVRDQECTHPYCDTPAPDCQVDHIVPAADGGPTTQENGRLLCGFHNRLRNQRPPPAA
jgi:hypothetical protein